MGSAKSWPIVPKIEEVGRQCYSSGFVWSWSTGEAVCWEGTEEGLLRFVDCVFKSRILIEFSRSVQEFSVGDAARRSQGGGGYGLPSLPPTFDFIMICEYVCVFVCLCVWACGCGYGGLGGVFVFASLPVCKFMSL